MNGAGLEVSSRMLPPQSRGSWATKGALGASTRWRTRRLAEKKRIGSIGAVVDLKDFDDRCADRALTSLGDWIASNSEDFLWIRPAGVHFSKNQSLDGGQVQSFRTSGRWAAYSKGSAVRAILASPFPPRHPANGQAAGLNR